MKKYLPILLLLVTTRLLAQSITIDEAHTKISFFFLDDEVKGTIEGFQFTGQINLDDLTHASISGSVATETLDTNNWLRNRHLRSQKYFGTSKFPKLSFQSNSIEKSGDIITVMGFLEIKGIIQPVTWSFKNNGKMLIGATVINTQDFNISIHKKRSENRVSMEIIMPYQ